MQKYAKLINEETKEVCVGLGTNIAFYKKIGMRLAEIREETTEEGVLKYFLIEFLPEEDPVQVIDEEEATNDEETKDSSLSGN